MGIKIRTEGRLVVLTGPTGVGKSTVVTLLVRRQSLGLEQVPTCTTRQKRGGELNGIHYHFLTLEQFDHECKDGKIIVPCEFAGNHYGTRWADIDRIVDPGGEALVTLELTGAEKIRGIYPGAVVFYLHVPFGTLYERARKRGIDEKDLDRRLAEDPLLSRGEVTKRGFHFIDNSGPPEQTTTAIASILAQ